MSTNVWTMNVGQVGKVLRGQLSDADGAVDLSQFDSVSVLVRRTPTGTNLVNQLCVIDVNQTTEVDDTGKGWLTFTTEATAATLTAHTYYYLLFKCLDGATSTYFPLNRRSEQTFGRLVVQPS